MKLFYFGSVCAPEIFNSTVNNSKVKPSASAQNFESALLKGFAKAENLDITAISAESIAPFPRGNRLFLKKRQDLISEGCVTQIIPAINLPILKQFCHSIGAAGQLKNWLNANCQEQEKYVLVYGIYPQVVKKLQKICKRYNCKIAAIIADVPSTMFTYTKSHSVIKRLFSNSYRQAAISLQNQFDSYIYLSEAMKDEVAPGKPYTVVETIADTAIFDSVKETEKSDPPALMYAGALYQKYGVDKIVAAFKKTSEPCELWFFGSGDYENELQKKAAENPRIKYFGRVSREEVLVKEKEASLLLNIRNAEDEYTKYSFPSKMIEYMLSGTPVLTTKLPGIPTEYYDYSYIADNRDFSQLALQIDSILRLGEDERSELGQRAVSFVVTEKNCFVQANKILDFLKKQI